MGFFDAELNAAMVKANGELAQKSIYVIQCETALTWGGRALSAYETYRSTGQLQALLDAEEYAHESLEHAALAGPNIYTAVLERLHEAKMALSAVPLGP